MGRCPAGRPQTLQTERPEWEWSAIRPDILRGQKWHRSRRPEVSFPPAKRFRHKRSLLSPAESTPRTPTLPPTPKDWEPELVVARHRLDFCLCKLQRPTYSKGSPYARCRT